MFEDVISFKFLASIILWVHPDKEEGCVTKIRHDQNKKVRSCKRIDQRNILSCVCYVMLMTSKHISA